MEEGLDTGECDELKCLELYTFQQVLGPDPTHNSYCIV